MKYHLIEWIITSTKKYLNYTLVLSDHFLCHNISIIMPTRLSPPSIIHWFTQISFLVFDFKTLEPLYLQASILCSTSAEEFYSVGYLDQCICIRWQQNQSFHQKLQIIYRFIQNSVFIINVFLVMFQLLDPLVFFSISKKQGNSSILTAY